MNPRTRHSPCPACGATEIWVFFEIAETPTHVNFLSHTAEEARNCTRGDIRLGFCETCGLITNVAFDEALLEYREGYENSLHFSSVFQSYAAQLADDLVERHDLHGKDIVEVGCGRGDFLYMLCDRGGNRGVGFDPSHTSPPAGASNAEVSFVRDLYSEQYANYDADFICSRQTLEHVRNPKDLLTPIRRSIGDRMTTAVFFEVPNGAYTLRNAFVWDIIYEHTTYFTRAALERAFRVAGFAVQKAYETFDGQYLCVEATPSEEPDSDLPTAEVIEGMRSEITDFRAKYDSYVTSWRKRMDRLQQEGTRVAVWGAGSKGITFLNSFDLDGWIRYVVDVNPNKHGMFVAGTGHRIVPPEHVVTEPVDVIVVVNPIYQDEIKGQVSSLGLDPEMICL